VAAARGTTGPVRVAAADVLAHRVRVQQLDREAGTVEETAVLDLGVQDSGADGALWALANRGVTTAGLPGERLVAAWTVRGAPHWYRREDLPSVAAAVAPWSHADAAKRIYDAATPLRAAGIGVLDALDEVAAVMRRVVTAPTVKGEVSAALTAALPAPYLRDCRPCGARHAYEQPFRLAALRAGLVLQPGTSPPVLEPVPGLAPAAEPEPRHDLVRAVLHLLGPVTPTQVAGYVDAPVAEVKARWPDDAVPVEVHGQRRWVLADDRDGLSAGPVAGVRLLGPFDLLLQARDRPTLVADPARAKALWPVLGRPGAVLVDGRLAGLWRPRASGGRLGVAVEPWEPLTAAAQAGVRVQAERLAAHRGVRLTGVTGLGEGSPA